MRDIYYASGGLRPDFIGKHKGRMVRDPMQCSECIPIRDEELPWMWRCDCTHSLAATVAITGPW